MGYIVGFVALYLVINGLYRIINQFHRELPSRWRIYSGAVRIAASAILVGVFNVYFSTAMVIVWAGFALVIIAAAELYCLIFNE